MFPKLGVLFVGSTISNIVCMGSMIIGFPLFMEAATSPLESKPKSHQVCWEIVSYFLFDPLGCS